MRKNQGPEIVEPDQSDIDKTLKKELDGTLTQQDMRRYILNTINKGIKANRRRNGD